MALATLEPMKYRSHRARVRNAWLHLFVLLILLPAFLPLPLLFALAK